MFGSISIYAGVGIAIGAVALIAVIAALTSTFFTVEQRTTAIVQRLGKFVREAGPGLNVKVPFLDRVAGRINLRVQQLDVKIETKTEDNVFVQMVVAVQFYVLPEKVYDAFYKLENANRQITSFVFDVVRAQVPKIKLDDVFEKKDDIANIVKSELAQVMEGFGYGILKALVTDIDPDPKVKEAMNEINAAQRMRVAATEKGPRSAAPSRIRPRRQPRTRWHCARDDSRSSRPRWWTAPTASLGVARPTSPDRAGSARRSPGGAGPRRSRPFSR